MVAQHRWIRRHTLIATLLGASGLSFWGTAFVPEDGVVLCFLWGFIRGIASSWPEFLLGLTLIDTARGLSVIGDGDDTCEGGSDVDINGEATATSAATGTSSRSRYEEIVSVFQAQAATSRNVGSLTAGILTFILFAWRHYRHVRGNNGGDDDATEQDISELSDTVVTMLLLLTGCLPFVGSVIAIRHKVGTVISEETNGEQGSSRRTRQNAATTYNEVAATDENDTSELGDHQDNTGVIADPESIDFDDANPLDIDFTSFERTENAKAEQRSYCAILVLFQLLLILGALKGPLSAVTTHVAWLSAAVMTSCFLVVSICAAMYYRSKSGSDEKKQQTNQVPARRLALYLLLRHSLPSSGYVYYSFLFAVFENSPVYMQCLSILGSAGSTCSSYIYGKHIAKKYNSGWQIIRVIGGTTLLYSFSSLLNMVVYRQAGGGEDELIQGGLSFFWILAPIYFTSGVVAEINFLPSLMLSTTNVSGSQGADADNSTHQNTEVGVNALPHSPFADEGMQYASYISCIDFAENIGSWITVPIVTALNITRENNFLGLDRLIFICSSAYLISLAYLCLIRPPPGETKVARLDMQSTGAEFA